MKLKFYQAINHAIHDSMNEDKNLIAMGLGINDKKGIFGTTTGLKEKFGSNRVLDIPTSENSITGICIGLAIAGYKTLLTHQRLDFALLSLDQIINNAAKTHYMYGGSLICPIVIRMIIGRGWGQGPTHSQNLQLLFAGIPGLKVVMPCTPQDAYSQLRASISCSDPVIFLEHRWLHNSESDVIKISEDNCLEEQKVIKKGSDISILAASYMLPEALKASSVLEKEYRVSCEVISFRNYTSRLDSIILNSVTKTNSLIVADTAQSNFSIGHQLVLNLCNHLENIALNQIELISMPDIPVPTSHYLTSGIYNNYKTIVEKVCKVKSIKYIKQENDDSLNHDIPGEWFRGPF